jgi:hypothetical protein
MNLRRMAIVACGITGCAERAKARGWCNTHYARWLRHGHPLARAKVKGDASASRQHSLSGSPQQRVDILRLEIVAEQLQVRLQ